jgi:type VI secretion system protein ImpC
MAHDARNEFHLTTDVAGSFTAPARPASRAGDGVFRLVLLGAYAGARNVDRATLETTILGRRAVRVDRDDIDAAIAALKPSADVVLDPSAAPTPITFGSLEDFHPDRLLARLPFFAGLRELKTQAARSRASSAPASIPAEALGEPPAPAGNLLDMIVDGDPNTPIEALRRAVPKSDLEQFLDRAVSRHLVRGPSAEETAVAAKVDRVIDASLRVLLHDRRLQEVEALWRGVDLLVRHLETSGSFQVFVVDLSREELAADLETAATVDRSAAYRLLASRVGAEGNAPNLIVGDFICDADDPAFIARLAALGAALDCPIMSGASPSFVGVDSFENNADPDDWSVVASDEWAALRRSPVASHLSLVAPRVILRQPYGRKSDAVDSMPFEELPPDNRHHESLLWGSGAVVAAAIAAAPVAEGDAPATHGTLSGLPFVSFNDDGDVTTIPCAEAWLGERAIGRLLDIGLTPLASMRDGDAVRAPRVQSIAAPPRALPIRAGVSDR